MFGRPGERLQLYPKLSLSRVFSRPILVVSRIAHDDDDAKTTTQVSIAGPATGRGGADDKSPVFKSWPKRGYSRGTLKRTAIPTVDNQAQANHND
jgi:hypothetical protein